MQPSAPPAETAASTGLRHNILSPLETLSQSISSIAPTTSPAMTVPLVFALAGNGTWLAYLLASAATLLMALCIARFARDSASPGSLYQYATDSLPPLGGRIAGWALLIAYIATGASVTGGFINYAQVLVPTLAGHAIPTPLLATICVGACAFIAYREVQASARLMLWIEAVSVLFIAIVVGILLVRNRFHVDPAQLHLHAVTSSGMRLGTVLALFSFVGFESATALGDEAKDPLRTIPRAVVQSAILSGLFFIFCAYMETLGFAQVHGNLGQSPAPMRVLATLAGIPLFGPLIDVGALISMFACTLACIVAAARVLLRMAQAHLVPAAFARTHAQNETPGAAVLAVSLLVFLPAAGLALRGISGTDIYAWLGSLALYGFITTYGLVAVALPLYLRRRAALTPAATLLAAAATLTMLAALAGTLYPVPPHPYNRIPWIFLACLAPGLLWIPLQKRLTPKPVE